MAKSVKKEANKMVDEMNYWQIVAEAKEENRLNEGAELRRMEEEIEGRKDLIKRQQINAMIERLQLILGQSVSPSFTICAHRAYRQAIHLSSSQLDALQRDENDLGTFFRLPIFSFYY